MKKFKNYIAMDPVFREFVDRIGPEEALAIYGRFEAAARNLGYDSIATNTVKIQREICDEYGLPYPDATIH